MSDWNSKQYLKFQKERTQPAIDLVSRIALDSPTSIIDIGCGPGNSSAVLQNKLELCAKSLVLSAQFRSYIFSVAYDISVVGRNKPRHYSYKRGFSRTAFSHKWAELVFIQIKAHIIGGGKFFAVCNKAFGDVICR